MMTPVRRLAQSSAIHVLFAFVAMGGWAVFANSSHLLQRALFAGLVQGALSAGLTFFLKTVIERLAKQFKGRAGLWAPPLIACLASTAVLISIHALSGTPEILKTIAVPLTVSTTYAAVYNYFVYQERIVA